MPGSLNGLTDRGAIHQLPVKVGHESRALRAVQRGHRILHREDRWNPGRDEGRGQPFEMLRHYFAAPVTEVQDDYFRSGQPVLGECPNHRRRILKVFSAPVDGQQQLRAVLFVPAQGDEMNNVNGLAFLLKVGKFVGDAAWVPPVELLDVK